MVAPPEHRNPAIADLPADLVVVGRIGAAHGVAGAMRVTSFTVPPDNILHYRPWYLGDGDRFRPVEVERVTAARGGFLAWLSGIGNREQAQALAGELIAVDRGALPPLDEGDGYYWRDLIGLQVVDGAGRPFGTVERLIDTGVHDVLVIQGDRETLIPFTAEFVLEVDTAAGRIVVDWQDPI